MVNTPTVTCPSGHRNQTSQKFCGQCGVALTGICPNGHQNPPDQRYCGECGTNIPAATTAKTLSSRVYLDVDPAQETPEPADPEHANDAEADQRPPVVSNPKAALAHSVADSSATAWYNRQSPITQIWISVALFIPILVLYMVQDLAIDPTLDRSGQHVANGLVTVIYGLYFVAVIAWVARDRQSRQRALVVAAAVVILDILFSWPVPVHRWASLWVFSAIVVGYVAAWGVARRQHRAWWWGLVLSAILCTTYRYFILGTDLTGWAGAWFRYQIAFVIGCLTCLAFDYGNRLSKASKNQGSGG